MAAATNTATIGKRTTTSTIKTTGRWRVGGRKYAAIYQGLQLKALLKNKLMMKSLSDEIEIGMSVIGKIYLHLADQEDITVSFDVSKITHLDETPEGTVVSYAETGGQLSSFVDVHQYLVKEKKSEIEKAYTDVQIYRNAALEKINSLLD